MVVGGGISGVQAALDLADSGFKVYLVEKKASIGGTMAQLDKTFPTNDCSMCIMAPKLVASGRHQNIELITNSEVTAISGQPGHFEVELLKKARSSVDMNECTGCGVCLENCPIRYEVQLPDLELRKARTAYAKSTDEVKVTEIIAQHRDEPGNLLPILLGINRYFNWLPRCALEHVSDNSGSRSLKFSAWRAFTTLSAWFPVGSTLINICMGTGCFVGEGAPGLFLDRLERELGIQHGQTTQDELFSLEVVRCIGCCALAPAMRIGESTFGRLTPSVIPRILKSYAESCANGHEEEAAA